MADDAGEERLRMFVAVDLPPQVKDRLARLQDALRPTAGGVRWANPSGIHLTLKFLGPVGKGQLPQIEGIVREVARGSPPFSVSLNGLGVFPNRRAPRVLWVAVQEQGGVLGRIQGELEERMERVGFAREERAFSPHLTLGRAAGGLRPTVVDAILERKPEESSFEVTELRLMRSEPRPGGSVYTTWLSAPLAGRSGPAP